MSRSLPVVLLAVAMTVAASAQAKLLRTTGKELFCQNRENFPEYLAVVHNKQFKYHTVTGCREVAKGTGYEVLEDNVETGMSKVRLFVWPRPIDGYMLVGSDDSNE